MEYAREIVMTSLRNNFSIFLFKYIGDGIRWECTVDFSSGASISGWSIVPQSYRDISR